MDETVLALLKKNAARYEFLRTLSPVWFNAIWTRALMTDQKFDDIVDEEMKRAKGEKIR